MATQNDDVIIIVDSPSENDNNTNVQQPQHNPRDPRIQRHFGGGRCGSGEGSGRFTQFTQNPPSDNMKGEKFGPRFANCSNFEPGTEWKPLYELYAEMKDALKKEFEMEIETLKTEIECSEYEHETEMLRSQLRNRDIECRRLKRKWELKVRQAEEARQRSEEQMRRQQQELQATVMQQEAEFRRRQQQNILFMQAYQLDKMLDQQEQAYDRSDQRGTFNNMFPDMAPAGNIPMDPTLFMNAYDLNQRFHGQGMMQLCTRGSVNIRGSGHWSNRNRGGIGGGNRNDFPNKKRRY